MFCRAKCNGRGGVPPVVISCMCLRQPGGLRWSFVNAFGCNKVGCCGGVLCGFCFQMLVEAFVDAPWWLLRARGKAPIAWCAFFFLLIRSQSCCKSFGNLLTFKDHKSILESENEWEDHVSPTRITIEMHFTSDKKRFIAHDKLWKGRAQRICELGLLIAPLS